MTIDKAEVRRIARLAHLEHPRVRRSDGSWSEPPDHLLDDATLERLAADMRQVLEHVKELDEVRVEGVEATSHGVPLPTGFREDEPGAELQTDRALLAAPQRIGDAIAVPRIVE